MKIQYREGSLFADLPKHSGVITVIPHVCNNVGKWGAGFTKILGEMYPQLPKGFPQCNRTLGYVAQVTVQLEPEIIVHNMIAQDGVGTDRRRVRYDALVKALCESARLANEYQKDEYSKGSSNKVQIMAPMFGAGLGGGNWDFIEQLIIDCWSWIQMPVTIYYLPGKTPAGWTPPTDT